MLRTLSIALACLLGTALMSTAEDAAIAVAKKFIAEKSINKDNPGWRLKLPKFPKLEYTKGKNYYWNLETSKGNVKVKFLPEEAPNHVSNFVYLTELGYFDGLTFHRVITEFMAQGGCPIGRGTGGPGYEFAGEYPAGHTKHDKPGILSMANAGPGTDGSQFFLTFVPTPWLDGKHTVFGVTESGLDTLEKLEAAGSRSGTPNEPLRMVKATITVED